jgi:hypothetical protein
MTTDPKARPVSQRELQDRINLAYEGWLVSRSTIYSNRDDAFEAGYRAAIAQHSEPPVRTSAAQQSEGVSDDVVARAKTIAHSIYCELGYCGGDAMCFEGADEATKARWIEAVSAALSAVREAAPMAAQHPAPESAGSIGATTTEESDGSDVPAAGLVTDTEGGTYRAAYFVPNRSTDDVVQLTDEAYTHLSMLALMDIGQKLASERQLSKGGKGRVFLGYAIASTPPTSDARGMG